MPKRESSTGDFPAPALRVVPKGERSTPAVEIVQVEFRALRAFRGLSDVERMRKADAIIDGLRPMAMIAAEFVLEGKPELIARVQRHYKEFGPILVELAKATSDAKLLADIMQAAECRLAAARASLESGRRS